MYHLVCTVKYRRDVLTEAVTNTLVNVCMEIAETSDIEFLEIGTDVNHVHFLIQTTPSYSIAQYVKLIKGKTANIIFKMNPEIKTKLWGGEFWSDGYWIVTVSKHGSEDVIRNYVKNQGKNKYDLLYKREENY
jgi:REP element-mobilizing transposase RayT